MVTYYCWLPLFILILLFGVSIFKKCPFKTRQAREIWENMTESELKEASNRSFIWALAAGVFIGVIPCCVGLVFSSIFLKSTIEGLIYSFFVFHIVLIIILKRWSPRLNKSWQLLLSSTEWAQQRGIEPEDIPLF